MARWLSSVARHNQVWLPALSVFNRRSKDEDILVNRSSVANVRTGMEPLVLPWLPRKDRRQNLTAMMRMKRENPDLRALVDKSLAMAQEWPALTSSIRKAKPPPL